MARKFLTATAMPGRHRANATKAAVAVALAGIIAAGLCAAVPTPSLAQGPDEGSDPNFCPWGWQTTFVIDPLRMFVVVIDYCAYGDYTAPPSLFVLPPKPPEPKPPKRPV